jgi:hypothetical protein
VGRVQLLAREADAGVRGDQRRVGVAELERDHVTGHAQLGVDAGELGLGAAQLAAGAAERERQLDRDAGDELGRRRYALAGSTAPRSLAA